MVRKILANLVIALVICLTMLLFITARLIPQNRYPLLWQAMVIKQDPAAAELTQWFSPDPPPRWLRDLAVVWREAKVATWWWLPLVFFGLRWFIMRWGAARRKRA